MRQNDEPVTHHDLRSQDLVATVQMHFHEMPTLIFGADEWEKAGGYLQILRDYGLSGRDVKSVKRTAMKLHDFANLGDWQP